MDDVNTAYTGNLMLAIQARTFNTYFYISNANNSIHPPLFRHKVAGILSENKVDYTSLYPPFPLNATNPSTAYFGSAPALIHGIHMVPIAPPTAYLRPRTFVKEEWDAMFDNGRANVDGKKLSTVSLSILLIPIGGWRGILYANLASIDARASYTFFRDGINGFWDERWIDGGASRTWYLVWAAAMVLESGSGGRR
jgi:endo-1,3(4)-beta-glucanase